MKFKGAEKLLKQGEKVRRKMWGSRCFIYLDSDGKYKTQLGNEFIPNEDWPGQLRTWLTNFGIFPDEIFMRRAKDFSKDWEVKKEIWQTQIRPFYEVLGVFEDRADCVAMWRSFGLTCYQPREANY